MNSEYVKNLFEYDASSGDLIWKTRPMAHFKKESSCKSWNTKYSGKRAVTIDGKGYRVVTVDRKRYLVHRLIWLYVYGKFPIVIDHINGDKLDNRIVNLREVTSQQNNLNRRMASNNTSGVVGVYFNKSRGLWCAQMKFKGRTYHLGSSKKIEDAISMRKTEEKRLGFAERHGENVKSR